MVRIFSAVMIVLVSCSGLWAASLERVTTADGRSLTGYYDPAAGTLTLDMVGRPVVQLPASQVVARVPVEQAPPLLDDDPARRAASDLARLEAEALKAENDAARLRELARTRNGQEASELLRHAAEYSGEATSLRQRLRTLQIAVDKERQAQVAVQTTTTGQPGQPGQLSPEQTLSRAFAEGEIMRRAANQHDYEAAAAWLQAADLSPLTRIDLPADPRASDVAYQTKRLNINQYRAQLRDFREQIKDQKDAAWQLKVVSRVKAYLTILARD